MHPNRTRWFDLHGEALPDHRGIYDTVLLLGRNIGIAGTIDRAPEVLAKCRELLAPGGSLITNSVPEAGGSAPSGRAYPGELRFRTKYKGKTGDWIDWLHVDYQTLATTAIESGWRIHPILIEETGECSAILR